RDHGDLRHSSRPRRGGPATLVRLPVLAPHPPTPARASCSISDTRGRSGRLARLAPVDNTAALAWPLSTRRGTSAELSVLRGPSHSLWMELWTACSQP